MENEHNKATENQTLKDKLMAIILLETAKDYKKMDSDLVTECVDFLMELEGIERLTKEEIEQRVNEIPFKGKVVALNSYAKKKLRAKRIAVIAAVLAVIIALFGIFAIGSGDTVTEFFRQMGNSIHEFLDGSPKEYNNITFYKYNETKTFSSIEEFIESEGIEILYPTWLPEDEKIVSIWYIIDSGTERYVLQSSNPFHSISIDIDRDFSKDVELGCTQIEIGGYLVYYDEASQFIQADFMYNNCWYLVKSNTKDNLFKIIENLKEIN